MILISDLRRSCRGCSGKLSNGWRRWGSRHGAPSKGFTNRGPGGAICTTGPSFCLFITLDQIGPVGAPRWLVCRRVLKGTKTRYLVSKGPAGDHLLASLARDPKLAKPYTGAGWVVE